MISAEIKHVKGNWSYLKQYMDFAKVTLYNEFMHVKAVSLKKIEFTPIFNDEVTIDKIKEFYFGRIDKNWSTDIKDFKERYKNLVEVILYCDSIIILKFEREKYLNFFNIKEGYLNFNTERLFAPYLLKVELEYTTAKDKVVPATIEFRFNDYVDDALIISKLTSRLLTIETKGFCAPDYVVILRNKYDTNEYQK